MRYAQKTCGNAPLKECPAPADVPLVATIVLNWNNTSDTIRCIAAAAETEYPNQRIYLFDNGADAASRAALSCPFRYRDDAREPNQPWLHRRQQRSHYAGA